MLCTKDSSSSDSVVIKLNGFNNINTSGEEHHGVMGIHSGSGDIDIVSKGSTDASKGSIETTGLSARGIYAVHSGAGATGGTVIDVSNDTSITTGGNYAEAIAVLDHGDSNTKSSRINVYGSATLKTKGDHAHGIFSQNAGKSSGGNIDINVYGSASVTADGKRSYGIFGDNQGKSSTGNVDIDVYGGASITTKGETAFGVFGWNRGADSQGDVEIDVHGAASVATQDQYAHGIYGLNQGSDSKGDITLGVAGGASVTTKGSSAFGVFGLKYGDSATGNITMDVAGGAEVTTEGSKAHGLYAGHVSGDGNILAKIGAGSSVTAKGSGASGVQIGRFNSSNEMERVAKVGTDQFRQQTVRVDGSVRGGSGDAAGIYLVGGGKVIIGPQGTVGAKSGTSIHAARKPGKDPNKAPALYLELNLDGRKMAEVFQSGLIVNDGDDNCDDSTNNKCGGTTIIMNGVKLHDRKTGATSQWASNGAWNVSVKSAKTIDDRDFSTSASTSDFFEESTARDGNSDNNFNNNSDSDSDSDFDEQFAARGTVYEALPRFLFRIDGLGSAFDGRTPRPGGKSNWFRFSGASDSFDARTSTVNTRYDYDRLATETGRTFRLGGGLSATLGLRVVSGSAGAESQSGRGGLDALGRGLSAGLEWNGGAGNRIAARAALTRYDLDVESSERGALVDDVSASVRSFRVEAGRSLPIGKGNRLELAGWLRGSDASVDGFTDTAGARVPKVEEGFLAAGASASAETKLTPSEGNGVVLRGSLGLERTLDGNETTVQVSSGTFRSSEKANRVMLDLKAVLPLSENGSIGVGVGVSGLGSGDTHTAASGSFRFSF